MRGAQPYAPPKGLLLAGGALFLAGSILALALLPEWRQRPAAEPERYAERFRELARRVGLTLAPGTPKVDLLDDSDELDGTYGRLGQRAAAELLASRSGVRVRVSQPVLLRSSEVEANFRVELALDGQPLRIGLSQANFRLFRPTHAGAYEPLTERFERALLRPGETVEPPFAPYAGLRPQLTSRKIEAASPSQPGPPGLAGGTARAPLRLEVQFYAPATIDARRTFTAPRFGRAEGNRRLIGNVIGFGRVLIVLLVVFGAFTTLLARRSLDILTAAFLAGVAVVACDPTWMQTLPATLEQALRAFLGSSLGRGLWILLVWSAGESLLRVSHPGFTTSLDNLRRGRLGPRGGRAVLLGLGCGAGLAGLKLAVAALAVLLPGLSPAAASLDLPLFRADGSPVTEGILLAAHALLALGLAARFLPPRWVYPATVLAMAAALDSLPLRPGVAGFCGGALVAALLTWIARRLGLTTLLVAAVTSFVLPATLFAALNPGWMPLSLALCAALLLALLALGLAGLRRPEDRETEPLPQPAFMRRLEEERRVRYEVGLLGRMQAGLTPHEPPSLPGYEIAARSLLAGDAGGDLYDFVQDTAGGLWIAAGDVAGNGYPCAVAQAMIKATLLSVIAPGVAPNEVLRLADRVLRRAHQLRRFSTLALLRLDPATGEVVLGNAGHPYPLLVAEHKLTEIELPGLPLGLGPPRTYGFRRFTLAPGALLVLYSDGLADTSDRSGHPYGFERVREVVTVMGSRPALEVVDALINDARRHLEGEPAEDDVTVLAIRRS